MSVKGLSLFNKNVCNNMMTVSTFGIFSLPPNTDACAQNFSKFLVLYNFL